MIRARRSVPLRNTDLGGRRSPGAANDDSGTMERAPPKHRSRRALLRQRRHAPKIPELQITPANVRYSPRLGTAKLAPDQPGPSEPDSYEYNAISHRSYPPGAVEYPRNLFARPVVLPDVATVEKRSLSKTLPIDQEAAAITRPERKRGEDDRALEPNGRPANLPLLTRILAAMPSHLFGPELVSGRWCKRSRR